MTSKAHTRVLYRSLQVSMKNENNATMPARAIPRPTIHAQVEFRLA